MRLVPIAYLSSYTLSLLGNSIAGIALPLIVLQLTGSVLGMGALAAATAVPAVLAGLFVGVVIDRINRRTSSVLTDLVSAVAIAALPIVDLVTGLDLGWFILFGIIGSLGDVPGMTARDALLPAIVRHGNISSERLMGLRESLGAVAMLIGPAAAGTLMVLFDGPTVLWITAATSLLAALITLLVPRRVGHIALTEDLHSAPMSGWAQLREGWRVLFRSRFLMATTLLSLVSTIVLAALQALVLPVYFTLADQPGMLGYVLTALATGMLLGGVSYAFFGMKGRRRWWFVAGIVGTTVGFTVVATLASVWVVFAGTFVVGLSGGLFTSLVGVLMIERIPEQMRGRVMGTQNSMMTAGPPLGIVVAAVVTEFASLEAAAIMLAGVWFVAAVIGLLVRSLRSLEPMTEQSTEGATMGATGA